MTVRPFFTPQSPHLTGNKQPALCNESSRGTPQSEDLGSVKRQYRFTRVIFVAAVLASSLGITACAEHRYRVYDPYYNDYHRWDNNEIVYYNQWAVETHRDPHREYRKLSKEEQRQYWEWRHHHGDHDHDHDRR